MMKKVVLTLLIAVLVGGGAFAQMSMGFGAGFTADFQTANLTKEGNNTLDSDYHNTNYMGVTFNTYIDFTYVMFLANLGFLTENYPNADRRDEEKGSKTTWSNLDLGVYGKIPFVLSKSGFAFFPMFGIDYRMVLDATVTTGAVKTSVKKRAKELGVDLNMADMNTLWFKTGVGFDIPLGVQLYLRSCILYGIGLPSKFEREMLDKANKPVRVIDTIVNHGMDIRFALGFKF